jgi:hypothetical protein
VRRVRYALIATVVMALLALAPPASADDFNLVPLAGSPFAAANAPGDVEIADFDGDGIPDMAVTRRDLSLVAVFRGTGGGAFDTPVNLATGPPASRPVRLAVGDFDEDRKPDLAVANCASACGGSGAGSLGFIPNTSTPGSLSFGSLGNYTVGSNPQDVAAGDFDRDGNDDLAVVNDGSNTVTVLPGTGTSGLGAKIDFSTNAHPQGIAVGDLNGDRKDDIVTADFGTGPATGAYSVLLNSSPTPGTVSFSPTVSTATGTRPRAVALADFGRDGPLDMVLADSGTNSVSVRTGNGAGAFSAATDMSLDPGSAPDSVTVGDLDNDGKSDIVVPNTGLNTVTVMLGDGTATGFPTSHTQPAGTGPVAAAVGDLDNDAEDDLAVANRDSNNVTVLGNRAPAGASVVWVNGSSAPGGSIGRVSLDGTNPDPDLTRTTANPNYVATDQSHVYWAAGTAIGRMDRDGSNVIPAFITSANPITGVAVNGTHIYWAQPAGQIGRANLDGSGVTDNFVTGLAASTPQGLAVSANDADLYWGWNAGVGHVATASPGTPDPAFIAGGGQTFGVAVDASHIYYSNFGGGAIGRADIDGGNKDNAFIPGIGSADGPWGVAVDSGFVYWVNSLSRSLGRARLDGTQASHSWVRLRAADAPQGIAVLAAAALPDTTPPSPPTGLAMVPASPANNNNPHITGTAEPGSTVTIFGNASCSGAPVASGAPGAGFGPSGIPVTVLDNTTTTFSARATDAASNPSACSAGVTYVENSTPPEPPPPTAKKTANLEPKSGTVLVKCPGRPESTVNSDTQIKFGCRVDVTDGVVTLVTKDIKGNVQRADFFDGAFVVKQLEETEVVKKKKVKVLITELTLSVAKPTGCKKTSKSSLGTARRGGHLWGRGKGRYRTRGRRGSGAVRGTEWLTEERCEGTYFQVKTGVVEVKDFTLKKTVLLKKGKHYLAPAAKPKKKGK